MRNKTLNMALLIICLYNILPLTGFCQVPFNGVFGNILSPENHYHKFQWKILLDNKIALLMVSGQPPEYFYSLTLINDSGEIILGPDRVAEAELANTFATFDEKGVPYLVNYPRHSKQINMHKYNPFTKQLESRDHPLPHLGHIRAAKHLAGIGNVIYTNNLRTKEGEKSYTLIVDNPNEELFRVYDFDRIEGFRIPQMRESLYKISNSRILVLGTSASDGQSLLCKFVYDLDSEQMYPSEAVSFDDLIKAGAPEFEANISIKSQAFEYSGRIFYIAPSITSYGPEHCQVIIVELDQSGEVVLDDTKTPLKLEEANISESPENFVLLKGNDHSGGFWVLSLDNFPTLILDKEE